jgi:hypothetical protein
MIVGSRRIRQRILSRALGPRVFARAEAFAARVAREIAERRRSLLPPDPGRCTSRRARVACGRST